MRGGLIALFLLFLSGHVVAQTNQECLYSAVFYEANTESVQGKKAVEQVVKNRAREGKKSICSVVRRLNQFSWVGVKPFKQMSPQAAKELRELSKMPNVVPENTLYFYNILVHPKWAKKMKCIRIDRQYYCEPTRRTD